MEAYSKALGNNEYYEQVLRVITLLDKPEIKAIPLNGESWYEIDDIQDLDIAETIFCREEEKLARIETRYGGYWRYPRTLDFCHTGNPYFPNERLISELKANFERLVGDYPSGMRINSLLASKLLSVRQEYVCMGNGVTEMMREITSTISGKVGIPLPSFEEYVNRLGGERIEPFVSGDKDFNYTVDEIMQYYAGKEIEALVLLNPDNPSGNYIAAEDMERLCAWTQERNIRFVIDESYIAFAQGAPHNSMLNNTVLSKYKNLIILKSISEPYGVPGLRLGILASGDTEFVSRLRHDLPIWNINSVGEFFMQIIGKYEKAYLLSCKHYVAERERVVSELSKLPALRVIPSQGNYLLCEVLGSTTVAELAGRLLNQHQILIKECSGKKGLEGRNFIRIALRTKEDNDILIQALQQLL